MDSLRSLLPKKSPNPLYRAVSAARVVECAQELCNEVLGPLASRAKVVSVRNKVLTISSTETAILGELRLKEAMLKTRINTAFKSTEVERIRFLPLADEYGTMGSIV